MVLRRFSNALLPLLLLLFGAAASLPRAALAVPTYQVTQVAGPNSNAYGINGLGQVVGSLTGLGGEEHAFLYNSGFLSDLGTLGGATSSALGINDAGVIVGRADNGAGQTRAFRYAGGGMSDLGTLGGATAYATAINNAGQITGAAATAGNESRAFLYSGGLMQNLGTLPSTGEAYSSGHAINESGQVGGNTSIGEFTPPEPPSTSFLYSGGVMTDLGGFGGQYSSVEGINDLGQAVGIGATSEFHVDHAFLFSAGVLQDIGTLPGGDYASASDINNLGQVVGFSNSALGLHGFLYQDGAMVDLNSLIDPLFGWTITRAAAINQWQQIAGTACNAGGCFAVRLDLLTPIPEPASYVMMLAGLALLGAAGRGLHRPARDAR